mmetsp:Transcript_25898/g.46919  ORF Transcript_25898/g.46919 Transcript_25898/m.46919 type:complete len:219 (+) Transcript_25898:809-1465(+)
MFFLNCWNNAERQVDIICYAIAHKLKLSIWRNEGDRSVSVKLSQPHTAMESAVINFHTRFTLRSTLFFNDKLIVQAKFALRHTRKFCIHLHLARDLVSQDAAGTRKKQVDAFEHININLILFVSNPFPSPIDGSGNLTSKLRWFWFVLRTNISEVNIETQYINSAVLWVTKIHCFVHELINEGHIVAHRILIKVFPEISFEDFDLLEKVLKYKGRVYV